MVIVVDIDDTLTRQDLLQYFYDSLKWPWDETHFILSDQCWECYQNVVKITANGIRHLHFDLLMTKKDIKYLLNNSRFWCDHCDAFIYDHYPKDECTVCS